MPALLPLNVQQALPVAKRAVLLGHNFFPNLISYPMSVGLHSVFYLSLVMCLVAALASLLRGKAQTVTSPQSASQAACLLVALVRTLIRRSDRFPVILFSLSIVLELSVPLRLRRSCAHTISPRLFSVASPRVASFSRRYAGPLIWTMTCSW